jgi:hypothetical protein
MLPPPNLAEGVRMRRLALKPPRAGVSGTDRMEPVARAAGATGFGCELAQREPQYSGCSDAFLSR